tara:strand:+ start:84 stop:686 length:603 start_codon:yes stop_codon:yes gene_type:complete
VKNQLIIYSNDNVKNFIESALSFYEVIFKKLDSIDYKNQNTQAGIIIINNSNDFNLINLGGLNDNYLIISNLIINNINIKKKIKIIKTPITINYLKNRVDNFVQNIKIKFHDLCIHNEKLTNLNNDSFCYLTKVELEILTYLIREKETSKNYIKQNILNIKKNIETNSLESHLTRIRKKMSKVNTIVKIQTKNEKLLIAV